MQIPSGVGVIKLLRSFCGLTVAMHLASCGQQADDLTERSDKGDTETGATPGGDWIAGTVVIPPPYDTDAGGWNTERVAALAGSQLNAFAQTVDEGEESESDWESIASWFGEGFEGQSFVLGSVVPEAVHATGDIKVARVANPESTLPKFDKGAFLSGFRQQPGLSKTQFKVVV